MLNSMDPVSLAEFFDNPMRCGRTYRQLFPRSVPHRGWEVEAEAGISLLPPATLLTAIHI